MEKKFISLVDGHAKFGRTMVEDFHADKYKGFTLMVGAGVAIFTYSGEIITEPTKQQKAWIWGCGYTLEVEFNDIIYQYNDFTIDLVNDGLSPSYVSWEAKVVNVGAINPHECIVPTANGFVLKGTKTAFHVNVDLTDEDGDSDGAIVKIYHKEHLLNKVNVGFERQ